MATIGVHAQSATNLAILAPTEDYDNVFLQKVWDGPEATGFVIWIKEGVRAHYHEVHAEQIFVLAGSGSMTLNGEEFLVGPGDYVAIPKGSKHAVTVTSEEPLKVLSIQAPQFFGKDRIWVEEDHEEED